VQRRQSQRQPTTAPRTASQSFGDAAPCVPTPKTRRPRQAKRRDQERTDLVQSLIRRRGLLEQHQVIFPAPGLEPCTGPLDLIFERSVRFRHPPSKPTLALSDPTHRPDNRLSACVVHQHRRRPGTSTALQHSVVPRIVSRCRQQPSVGFCTDPGSTHLCTKLGCFCRGACVSAQFSAARIGTEGFP
jgi:hypothetical protein